MSDFELNTIGMAAHVPASPVEGHEQRKAPAVAHETRLPQQATEHMTVEHVRAAAEQIDAYLKNSNRELEFEVDERSGQVVVRVRDPATGDVIRQIPGEEVLRMARALHENTSVLLNLTV